MRRSDRNAVAAISNGEPVGARPKSNGRSEPDTAPVDLVAILASLQTMRDGDFSVRLPGSWIGLAGRIADTFNEIVATNQQMAEGVEARRSSGGQGG